MLIWTHGSNKLIGALNAILSITVLVLEDVQLIESSLKLVAPMQIINRTLLPQRIRRSFA
jgi:hypothetical protein